MPPIGPTLPPYLAKRKRTPEQDGPDSPPGKRGKSQSDEIDLEESDDDIGPSTAAPETAPSAPPRPSIGPALPPVSKPSIGPTLPQAQCPANRDEIELDSDADSDAYVGPVPRSIGPSLPPSDSKPAKRVLGPAPPPADLSARPAEDPDSSSDDEYGPAVAASETAARRQAVMAQQRPSIQEAVPAPKRDEWMLVPPSERGYRAPDPTKLKNRRFASGKSASSGGGDGGGGVSSLWTETADEKLQRLEDAVLGRGADPAPQAGPARRGRTQEELDRERRISEYTGQTRGKSLYEAHQTAKEAASAAEDEDDPSKRAFDKEKDMALGGKIGTAQRREMLNRAADFGGRFQKGSYL